MPTRPLLLVALGRPEQRQRLEHVLAGAGCTFALATADHPAVAQARALDPTAVLLEVGLPDTTPAPAQRTAAGRRGADPRADAARRQALLPDPAALADALRVGPFRLDPFLQEVRYAVLDAALAETGGVAERAARLLGANPFTLRRHLRHRPRRLAPPPAAARTEPRP